MSQLYFFAVQTTHRVEVKFHFKWFTVTINKRRNCPRQTSQPPRAALKGVRKFSERIAVNISNSDKFGVSGEWEPRMPQQADISPRLTLSSSLLEDSLRVRKVVPSRDAQQDAWHRNETWVANCTLVVGQKQRNRNCWFSYHGCEGEILRLDLINNLGI